MKTTFGGKVTRRTALGAMAAAGAAFAVPTIVMAAPPKQSLDVVVGSEHALVYLPWDLAKGAGFFEMEGLDVNLSYTKGGSEAAQALVSGSCNFSGNAIDHAIASQKQGKGLVMIADFMDQPGVTLMTRTADKGKWKTMKDLNGEKVGVTSIGAATHVIGVWMAHRAGLAKDDITFIGVGGGSTMPAALAGGQVAAAFGNDPFVTKMIADGRGVPMIDLFDPRQARLATGFNAYCFTGALTRQDVIDKQPELVQKVINGLVRAQKFMARSSSGAVARAMGSDDMRGGLSVEQWAPGFSHSRTAFTDHGAIDPEGVAAVIATNAYFLGEAAQNVTAANLYNNTFVEKANKTVKV
jgi:NitT/TauT family transport system substrate-binding protein